MPWTKEKLHVGCKDRFSERFVLILSAVTPRQLPAFE